MTDDYRAFLEAQPVPTLRDWSLVTHFREEAADPEVAELLRVRYVDYLYLLDHAAERRFDQGPGT